MPAVPLGRADVAGVLEGDPRMPGLEQHREHLAPEVGGLRRDQSRPPTSGAQDAHDVETGHLVASPSTTWPVRSPQHAARFIPRTCITLNTRATPKTAVLQVLQQVDRAQVADGSFGVAGVQRDLGTQVRGMNHAGVLLHATRCRRP